MARVTIAQLRASEGPLKDAALAHEQIVALASRTPDHKARRATARLAIKIGHYDESGLRLWHAYLANDCPAI